VAIGQLHNARFTDRNRGTAVILGLGLLLRECWRAVKGEPDSQVPEFLHNSRLGVKRAGEVVAVIRDVLARFEARLNDGAQAVEDAQASSGGVGDAREMAEVQVADGEKVMDVDVVEETGTGESVTEVAVQGVEGPPEVVKVELVGAKRSVEMVRKKWLINESRRNRGRRRGILPKGNPPPRALIVLPDPQLTNRMTALPEIPGLTKGSASQAGNAMVQTMPDVFAPVLSVYSYSFVYNTISSVLAARPRQDDNSSS
jgi:hypothetical protein